MPAFDHHLMPLHPPLEGDSYLRLQSQGSIDFRTNSGHDLRVRFLCLDEQVRAIAVTVPEIASGHKHQSKWMKQIMETAISALRLSVDPEAAPIVAGDGFINLMYQSEEPEPRYQVAIAHVRNPEYRLDISRVLGVFGVINNRALASILALLTEGQVPTIPPHYRMLSLIRALELLYPVKEDLRIALGRFDQHFAELGISTYPLASALPQLRTRCAHGRSRARQNQEPFVGIAYDEPHLLPMLTLLRSIVAHGLHELHGIELGGVQHGIPSAAP